MPRSIDRITAPRFNLGAQFLKQAVHTLAINHRSEFDAVSMQHAYALDIDVNHFVITIDFAHPVINTDRRPAGGPENLRAYDGVTFDFRSQRLDDFEHLPIIRIKAAGIDTNNKVDKYIVISFALFLGGFSPMAAQDKATHCLDVEPLDQNVSKSKFSFGICRFILIAQDINGTLTKILNKLARAVCGLSRTTGHGHRE